ncbi:hypothetical protein LZC95_48725 [Pendulispora brunnea]|uniref:Uncharacterized protein n=1 Tax=Pendulispora brunnea TaxID=2905690 RepID=A0ABZ2K6L9_9BACT
MFKRQLAEEVEKEVAKARAADVLVVLLARNIPVNDSVRAKILACTEAALLERWLRHAATTATSAEDIVSEWEPLPPLNPPHGNGIGRRLSGFDRHGIGTRMRRSDRRRTHAGSLVASR